MLFMTRRGQVTGVLNISVVFYRQTLQSSGVFVTFNFHNSVNTVCRMAALILKMTLANVRAANKARDKAQGRLGMENIDTHEELTF